MTHIYFYGSWSANTEYSLTKNRNNQLKVVALICSRSAKWAAKA